MPKRDSSSADLDSPRDLRFDSWSHPMSTYRQRPSSSAASSSAAAASSNQGLRLPGYYSACWSNPQATYGYAAASASVPMPRNDSNWHPPEDYPLQDRLSQNQRVLHTQVLKEVTIGHGANQTRQLMVTEIDNVGTERNRRPEFFFNGILGHVKDRWEWNIDSWKESSRLANYWRRFFDIEEVPYSSTSDDRQAHLPIHDPSGPPDESDNAGHGEEEQDDVAGDTSTMGNTGELSVPRQIHQLAAILYNALTQDPEFNAAILGQLQIPPENPSESNLKLFNAAELGHVGSHLAITTNILAQQAQPAELGDIFDISDEIDHDVP